VGEVQREKTQVRGPHRPRFQALAARELRKAGVPESTIMDIGGGKTPEMSKRYCITDSKEFATAITRHEAARIENSHDFGHDSASQGSEQAQAAKSRLE
jgi:hypothetical protein